MYNINICSLITTSIELHLITFKLEERWGKVIRGIQKISRKHQLQWATLKQQRK